jgi:hypothetical protein
MLTFDGIKTLTNWITHLPLAHHCNLDLSIDAGIAAHLFLHHQLAQN